MDNCFDNNNYVTFRGRLFLPKLMNFRESPKGRGFVSNPKQIVADFVLIINKNVGHQFPGKFASKNSETMGGGDFFQNFIHLGGHAGAPKAEFNFKIMLSQ